MKEDMEKLLNLIADTEMFGHDDELSRLIQIETDNELSEEDLELVSAARKGRYENFKQFLNSKGIE